MSGNSHHPVAPTQAELFPAGDLIARHRHDDHQLIYVSTGILAIQTEIGAWVASPDRAAWIPAGTWHEHRVYGNSSVHLIGFPVHDAPLTDTSPTVIAADALLRELLIACTDPGLTADEAHRIRAVLKDRLPRARVQPLIVPTARDPRLVEACELVVGDLSQPRSLPWLGRNVGASARTLTRLFRTEFGMTYPQWRTNVRTFHAMVQLAEGATVTEAAHRCGWATSSAFVDSFAHTMGQTPGTYRAAASPRFD
jgi:AraC-like DNA-binding protein